MKEDNWVPAWIRGSKIEEIVWVGKDVVAWSTGAHIMFFHIALKRQTIRPCTSFGTGDGACCLSGHTTLPIFAFCEKSIKPKIFIYGYPSMKKVAECVRIRKCGYLATAFTVDDYLVSLSSYPDFTLTIWTWRSGDKILEVPSPIRDEVGQILRVNLFGPTLIAQTSRKTGRLFIWDITMVNKVYVLKDDEVKLPENVEIYWVDWCPTPGDVSLAIVGKDGHIYLSNDDCSNVTRIVTAQHCNVCTEYELPSICWFRGGIVLKTIFCQIQYFRKNPKSDEWYKEWYVKSTTKPCLLVAHPLTSDYFFYYTLEGYFMQIDFHHDDSSPTIYKNFYYGSNYRFADFIYPWCHHLAAVDDPKELSVLECESGREIARVYPDINGNISRQLSHPDYPFVALTTTHGELVFISILNPEEPTIVAQMHLYKSLDLLKLSSSGRYLIAGHKGTGHCFCIDLQEVPYDVANHVTTGRQVIDIIAHDAGRKLRLLVLEVATTKHTLGDKFLIYDVNKNEKEVTSNGNAVIELPGAFRTVHFMPGSSELLVASTYTARQLQVLKLEERKDVEISRIYATNHAFRYAQIFSDRQWLTTTSFDGLAIVRDESAEIMATVATHHRFDHGSVKAMCNPSSDLIIVLGHNGSLVAMKRIRSKSLVDNEAAEELERKNLYRVDYTIYEKRKTFILSRYTTLDAALVNLLNRPQPDIVPLEENLSWVEWKRKEALEEEERAYAWERAKIFENFAKFKVAIRQMLDQNEASTDIEKLPISDYDLDKSAYEHALKLAKDERENARNEFEHYSACAYHVANWLKKTYWDCQKVFAKSIFSISDYTEVTNYSFVEESPNAKDMLAFAEFQRDVVRDIAEESSFVPWHIYEESQLKEILQEDVLKLVREDERHRMDALLEEEEEEEREEDVKQVEELKALEGMTTHRFVEQSPYYYPQLKSYGFMHVLLNNHYLMHDCKKLRFFFNVLFDELHLRKEREMNAIREKIERIRHIDSELRLMFKQSIPQMPLEPTWRLKEKPENVIRVEDHEVKVAPYISPSEEELLAKEAREAERIRLLLLADDFRERALIAMMDGVLEVRWEDTIKRDIPKPECMLKKDPKDYTIAEIQAVKQYEKDVEFLTMERERYRRILQADYVKMRNLMQEGMDKFNRRVEELCVKKMQVEAAIKQMELRHVRGGVRNYRRTKNTQKITEMRQRIEEEERNTRRLETEQLGKLQDAEERLEASLEEAQNRERSTGKKLRSEFANVGRATIDILEKQYKRRPRISLKNATSSELQDLGRCVALRVRYGYLSHACRDYLRALEHLDVRPAALPPSVDSHNWQHLVQMRRKRIQLELDIRVKLAQIERSQCTISAFKKKIAKGKERVNSLRKELAKLMEDRILFDQNTELQLVLKCGHVEVDLRGALKDDTADAILIPRNLITSVNDCILEQGSAKFKAMEHAINFLKNIREKECKHKALNMKIQHLQEDLRFVQRTTVTKDIQNYLKRKNMGFRDDRSAQRLEKEIATMQMYFAKIYAQWQQRLEETERRIAATRKSNESFDRMITSMNVVRCQLEYRRDLTGEQRQREHGERKMRMIVKRSNVIRELQDTYGQLLLLQTEHELLRLKRFPALKFFRTLDDHTVPTK